LSIAKSEIIAGLDAAVDIDQGLTQILLPRRDARGQDTQQKGGTIMRGMPSE
jgi:hypothetical protein